MNAVQNPIQQNNSWFQFGYIVLLIQSFAFLVKYLYKEKQVTSAAEIVHIIGQTEHHTNDFYYAFQMSAEWVVSQDSCSCPARAAMLHPGMKSVKLRLLTLLVLFSDSLFTFIFLLNSDKHLLLTELLFLALMITGIGIAVYPCAGLSKFYIVTITHLTADHFHWKCTV